MAYKIIKGDDLMVFDSQGNSMAWATSHTLSLTADAADINSKDHGIYGGKEINKINWEITTENLYSNHAFEGLYTAMMTRKPVRIFWGSTLQSTNAHTYGGMTVADGDLDNWTPAFGSTTSNSSYQYTPAYVGKAFITSLSANANTGENATFSATFSGTGKFVRADVSELSPAIDNSQEGAEPWIYYNADGSVYDALDDEGTEGGELTPANGNSIPATQGDGTGTGTGTNP